MLRPEFELALRRDFNARNGIDGAVREVQVDKRSSGRSTPINVRDERRCVRLCYIPGNVAANGILKAWLSAIERMPCSVPSMAPATVPE